MTFEETKLAIEVVGKRYSRYHIAMIIPDGPTDDQVQEEIAALKNSGLHVFLQESGFGRELVITDLL